MKYNKFSELPQSIKKRILNLNQPIPEEWIFKKIGALNSKSIIETMNETDGIKKINEYLNKVEGKFLL